MAAGLRWCAMGTFTAYGRSGSPLPADESCPVRCIGRLFLGVSQKKGGGPTGSRRPLIVSMSTYFRLAIAVRSNLPATTKDEPHQLEPKPPGLIAVTAFVKRAFWSLVKALQSP
jgi:hypothetical protein